MNVLILLIAAVAAQDQAPGDGGSAAWEVSGVVRNHRGPMKGVWVRVSGPGLMGSAQSGSGGRYSLKGTVPGIYSISIQKPDDGGEPRSRTIMVAAGQKIEGFDFVVPQGAVIAGRVTDAAGDPVTDMVVVAYLRSYESGRLRLVERGGAITDDRGAYRIAHLPDGEYAVGAVAMMRKPLRVVPRSSRAPSLPPAYPPVTLAPNSRTASAAAIIEVQDGAERMVPDITLQKEPGYCAFFTAPVPASAGFEVSTWVQVSEWIGTRGPAAAGGRVLPGQELQICGLPQGEYRFSFGAMSKQPLKLEGATRALHVAVGAARVDVTIDKEHREVAPVSLAAASNVRGRLTVKGAGPDGTVPAGMRVVLGLRHRGLYPGDRLLAHVQVDGGFEFWRPYPDEYIFRLENLPPGHYIVKAEQDGRDLREADFRTDSGEVAIELSADGPMLSGRVLTDDREPAPISEATVFLVGRAGGRVYTAQSNQEGAYSFRSGVGPGDYRVVAVSGLPESQRSEATRASRYLSRAADVSLRARERKVLDLKTR